MPLTTTGARRDSLFAFARVVAGSAFAITCVPRLIGSLMPDAPGRRSAAASGRTRRVELPASCVELQPAPPSVRDVLTGDRASGRADRRPVRRFRQRRCSSGCPSRCSCRRRHALPDDHRRRVHRLAHLVGAVHAAHPLPHRSRRSTPRSDHFVHVLESTCYDAPRAGQPRRDPHQRRRVLPGDARRDPRRRAKRSTWSATSSRKARSATPFIDALCERARAGVRVTHRAGRHRQLRRHSDSRRDRCEAAGCRVDRLPAVHLVSPGRLEQPDPPRAAGRRRHRGVRRRRRRRRLVVEAAPRQADVARHDGADRRAGGRATSRASSRRTGWSAAARS